MMPEGKHRYLVVHDYGQGGAWGFLWARSAAEIDDMFHDLKVVEDVPSWMTGETLAKIEEHMTFDVDAIEPGDWIASLLRPGT